MGTAIDPRWWSEEHRSSWERVKAAFRRDWEQTKADFSSKGTDLNQGVTDTVKQAAGKAPLPPLSAQTRPDPGDWERVEHAVRFGHGARAQYQREHRQWDDRLESKLETEWSGMATDQPWNEVKAAVRHGWNGTHDEP